MSPYNAYTKVSSNVDVDDKPMLLLKVFEMIQAKLDIIKGAMDEKDFEKKYTELTKVVQVIEILEASVDLSHGVISTNLVSLHHYMAKRLREVHREQDPAVVDECKTLIRTLQEGFSEAYKKERSTSFPVTNKTAGSGIKISL